MDGSNEKRVFRKINCFLMEAKDEKEIRDFFNNNDVEIFKIKTIIYSYKDKTSLFKVVVSQKFDLGAAKAIFHHEEEFN